MRRSQLAVVAVATAVLAVGCTDDRAAGPTPAAGSATPASDAVTPSATPPPLEGDARSVARWPDGVTAQLAKVERVPSDWGVDIPKGQALVRLRLVIGNEGAGPLPIAPNSSWVTLYYGVNRTEGEREAGYSYNTAAERERKSLNSEDEPTRIMPGTKATYVETYAVPAAELGALVAVATPPAEEGQREPYTFLGVEKALVEVKR